MAGDANVAQTGFFGAGVTETNASPLPGLNTTQWQTLLQMLGGSKSATLDKMIGKPWIIDTGASNHMTGTIGDLRDLREIAQCPVGLPDWSSAIATKEGTTLLDRNFCLQNVLYVPGLTCNLISVSQLTDHYNCFVQFTNDLCVIQDRTSRMLIGAGERRDGLYYFRGLPHVHAIKANSVVSLDLWHQRLGHPSLQQLLRMLESNCKDQTSNVFLDMPQLDLLWKEELDWDEMLIKQDIGREALWIHCRLLTQLGINHFTNDGHGTPSRSGDPGYVTQNISIFFHDVLQFLGSCLVFPDNDFEHGQAQAGLAASYIMWLLKVLWLQWEEGSHLAVTALTMRLLWLKTLSQKMKSQLSRVFWKKKSSQLRLVLERK